MAGLATSWSQRPILLAAILAVIAITFALDLLLPLGTVEGMGYLLIVPAFCLLPEKYAPIVGAVVASVCVIAGYLVSPLTWDPQAYILDPYLPAIATWSVPQEVALLNRGVALLAVWGLALAMYGRRRWKGHADREHLLAEETLHRLKNMLVQVEAIVRATRNAAPPSHDAYDLILARVEALSRTSGVLASERWEHASLRSVVTVELAVHGEDRFEVSGNDVHLSAKAAFLLSLVLHELATNATKYGALSVPKGRVKLCWYVSREDGKLVLDWKELDGRPVTPPSRRGFGTTLIERATAHELGAASHIDYASDGVHCRIEFPIHHVICEAGRPAFAAVERRAS